ncbi:MAG: hypothetical protein COT91_01645 [Candidatus Doudnabacteria bacterium CG10_big_fil_rev_8_21_14_0_10_41_10]|uniref:PEP-utilising enzyme mobile domain-containing protein n=1 Tax=Candidatus Doudnabacteria bacterium CG10_big_fil_rev_8_21_14_0_10_41_10 TaxID=1974551 RepID=A0A2H0VE78_9BACT|nr:MAG: hypothetical protein COT91_01645 [Candidatus Doudnabacteria bacterium CG10_big_fil_rev_8_21_14_0_10_41_10]
MDLWEKAHRIFIKRIKTNPETLEQFYKKIEHLGRRLIAFTKGVGKSLQKSSNQKLFSIYSTYIKLNTEYYGIGLLLPLLDYQKATFFSDEVNGILKKRDAEKHFVLLTTPGRETYNKQQELNLLRVYSEIIKIKPAYKLFQTVQAPEILKRLPGVSPKIFALLKQHTRNYTWVFYVYEGPAADMEYFVAVIRDLIKRKIDPDKELRWHRSHQKELKEEQANIIKKLKLTVAEKKMIELARGAVFFKPYRRELQSRSYFLMESVLREIATRLNLSLKQVRMMLPQEVKKALLGGRVDTGLLNKRSKAVVFWKERKEYCLSGKSAERFIKEEIKWEKINKSTKIFSGAVAYPGKATGRVKVINYPDEMKKMKGGDILVSDATNPNLMPAIFKAKAIVTNEGGLTCHAAIVSRELKIPCVVGTKFASKVLKDGDLVEVDAERGLVRKISR